MNHGQDWHEKKRENLQVFAAGNIDMLSPGNQFLGILAVLQTRLSDASMNGAPHCTATRALRRRNLDKQDLLVFTFNAIQ